MVFKSGSLGPKFELFLMFLFKLISSFYFYYHLCKMKFKIIITFLFFATNIYSQNWETNFEVSKNRAEKEKKFIIMVFQGSDWCVPCMKLDKEIWTSEEFVNYSDENLIMLKVDFPKKRKNKLSQVQQEHNNVLAEKYNTVGYFPFVVLVDYNGNVIGTTAYKKVSPNKYIEIIESFQL
jgi:thioredoxin-related protein